MYLIKLLLAGTSHSSIFVGLLVRCGSMPTFKISRSFACMGRVKYRRSWLWGYFRATQEIVEERGHHRTLWRQSGKESGISRKIGAPGLESNIVSWENSLILYLFPSKFSSSRYGNTTGSTHQIRCATLYQTIIDLHAIVLRARDTSKRQKEDGNCARVLRHGGYLRFT